MKILALLTVVFAAICLSQVSFATEPTKLYNEPCKAGAAAPFCLSSDGQKSYELIFDNSAFVHSYFLLIKDRAGKLLGKKKLNLHNGPQDIGGYGEMKTGEFWIAYFSRYHYQEINVIVFEAKNLNSEEPENFRTIFSRNARQDYMEAASVTEADCDKPDKWDYPNYCRIFTSGLVKQKMWPAYIKNSDVIGLRYCWEQKETLRSDVNLCFQGFVNGKYKMQLQDNPGYAGATWRRTPLDEIIRWSESGTSLARLGRDFSRVNASTGYAFIAETESNKILQTRFFYYESEWNHQSGDLQFTEAAGDHSAVMTITCATNAARNLRGCKDSVELLAF